MAYRLEKKSDNEVWYVPIVTRPTPDGVDVEVLDYSRKEIYGMERAVTDELKATREIQRLTALDAEAEKQKRLSALAEVVSTSNEIKALLLEE
jgi:hypothetical protein